MVDNWEVEIVIKYWPSETYKVNGEDDYSGVKSKQVC